MSAPPLVPPAPATFTPSDTRVRVTVVFRLGPSTGPLSWLSVVTLWLRTTPMAPLVGSTVVAYGRVPVFRDATST